MAAPWGSRFKVKKAKIYKNLAPSCLKTGEGQSCYGFVLSKPSASAVGESDYSGAGDLPIAFSSSGEQRHVQDLLVVGQGKAG